MWAPTSKLLSEFIERAAILGLQEADKNLAKEYLDYNEFELCFDQVVTQLYEYNIKVDEDFYRLAETIASKLGIPETGYVYLKELIRR
jgi:hypothetical protein